MTKYYILLCMLYIGSQVEAQEWTEKDSVWLKKILSGEEKLQLNEDTQRAIESGTLISRDPDFKDQLRINHAELPIMKSFEGITTPENRRKRPHELPLPVYKLYGMDMIDSLPDATKSTTFYGNNISELKMLEKLSPRRATVGDNISVRHGAGGFNAENLLRSVFWSSHRAKKRNKKNATAAAKTYNNY